MRIISENVLNSTNHELIKYCCNSKWMSDHPEFVSRLDIAIDEKIKFHVEKALENADNSAKMKVQPYDLEEWEIVPASITKDDIDDEDNGCTDGYEITIDKNSILTAYSYEESSK